MAIGVPRLLYHFAPLQFAPMPKVVPITFKMIVDAFVNAPEMKSITRFYFDCRLWLVRKYHKIKKPSDAQLLLICWALSHYICACGAVMFFTTSNDVWYYVCLSGAACTYMLMVMRQGFVLVNGFRQSSEGSPLSWILHSENFTLFWMAAISLFSNPRLVKTFSFCVYSVLNLSTFLIQKSGTTWFKVLMPILCQVEPSMLALAVYADFAVLLYYVMDIWDGSGTFTSAISFALLLLNRLDQSAVATSCFHTLIDHFLRFTSQFESADHLHRGILVLQNYSCILLPSTKPGTRNVDFDNMNSRSRIASSVIMPVEVIKDL